jgi:hypothetical protein
MPSGVYKRTAKHRAAISVGKIGILHSPEHNTAISVAHIGVSLSPEHKAAIKEGMNDPDVIAAISVAHIGVPYSPEYCAVTSICGLRRYKDPKEHEKTKEAVNRPEIQARRIETHNTSEYLASVSGKNSHLFINGLSNIYHPNFNEFFKKKIRTRDNNICQICGKTNKQNINETTYSLSVHHIHYDPETNDCSNSEDFVCLCISCHGMTSSGNHEYWENYFMMKKLLIV